MAKNEIGQYDETNSGNTDIDGIVLSDATQIDQLDDIARALMGALKRWFRVDLFRLQDNTDQTKLLALDLSGLATATTRTLTAQDKNGTIALTSDLTSLASLLDTRRNRIVNHDMRVSQENGTTAGTTNGYYAADQWAQYFVTSAGTLTVAQVASVTPAGSPNRLRATVTVADATLAAGEFWTLTQNLEGSNVADFQYGGASAKNIVLRFGFKGPAGTYAVSLKNSAANRSYVALFTIAGGEANTDTVQTISIAGDATGTWLTADGVIGLTLDIVLACGTTFQGSTGWQSGNILGTSGVSNGMGTGSAVFELFDVGLKLDPDATGIYGQYEVGEVHPVYRSERYLPCFTSASTGDTLGLGQVYATTAAYGFIPFLVETCKPPTGLDISSSAHVSVTGAISTPIAVSGAVSFNQASRRSCRITAGVSSGLAAGDATNFYFNNASGKIIFTGCRLS